MAELLATFVAKAVDKAKNAAEKAKKNRLNVENLALDIEHVGIVVEGLKDNHRPIDRAAVLQLKQVVNGALAFIEDHQKKSWFKRWKKANELESQYDDWKGKLEAATRTLTLETVLRTEKKLDQAGAAVNRSEAKLDEMKDMLERLEKRLDTTKNDQDKTTIQTYMKSVINVATDEAKPGAMSAAAKEHSDAVMAAANARLSGNIAEEETALRRAVAADPRDSRSYFNLGYLLQEKTKDMDGAEDAYKKGLAIEPKHAGAWNNLGGLLKDEKKDMAGAEDAYRQALAIEPKHADGWFNLGNLLKDAKKDIAGAEEAYRTALAINPKNARAWFNVGALRRDEKNDLKGAVDAWRKCIAADPAYQHAQWIRNFLKDK